MLMQTVTVTTNTNGVCPRRGPPDAPDCLRCSWPVFGGWNSLLCQYHQESGQQNPGRSSNLFPIGVIGKGTYAASTYHDASPRVDQSTSRLGRCLNRCDK